MVKEKLEEIREKAFSAIDKACDQDSLNDVRVKVLGKKGERTAILKGMKDVAPEDRPKVGALVNEARSAIEEKMAEARDAMKQKALEERLKHEAIDVTLPAKKNKIGHRHPNTIALDEVEKIFIGMGFGSANNRFMKSR